MPNNHPKVKKSVWPECRLNPNEKHFLSISIGNSSINWAFHGKKEDLNPTFFWRTPRLLVEDVETDNNEELANTFARYLPKGEIGNFFFSNSEQTTEAAIKENESRGHLPTFYIVSSDESQTVLFGKLVRFLPCRVIEMQADDFFTEAEGAYKGMGIDRLACLRGAMNITGTPVLVIDGGTAMTYTAMDEKGMIMGGGISCGIKMRMDALETFTSGLPAMDVEKELTRIIDEATKSDSPADVFATNTKDAMVIASLVEISAYIRSVIDVWMGKVGRPKKRKEADGAKKGKSSSKCNHDRVVALAGGAGNLIAKLLDENEGGILNSTPKPQIPAKHVNGLIHFGVTWVLCEKANQSQKRPHIADANGVVKKVTAEDKKKWRKYVGESVIKEFNANDGAGVQTFKGEVEDYSIWNSEDGAGEYPLYRIVYSDGDEEDVDLSELMRKCYLSLLVGETKLIHSLLTQCITLSQQSCWPITKRKDCKQLIQRIIPKVSLDQGLLRSFLAPICTLALLTHIQIAFGGSITTMVTKRNMKKPSSLML
jgi:pantothenate kinase type III